MDKSLEKKIDAIAGDEGWYKNSANEVYKSLYLPLINKGFSEDEALEFIESAYSLVSSEYGC